MDPFDFNNVTFFTISLGLVQFEKLRVFGTVVFLFLFDKYYPILE